MNKAKRKYQVICYGRNGNKEVKADRSKEDSENEMRKDEIHERHTQNDKWEIKPIKTDQKYRSGNYNVKIPLALPASRSKFLKSSHKNPKK